MEPKTILLVDDEESILFVLKKSLARLGNNYRILTAKDGVSALRFFGQFRIDLTITDYRMEGMTGLELLELIQNVQPGSRVILITAFGNDEIESEVNRLKAFAYLPKPLDLNTFRSIVLQALGENTEEQNGLIEQEAGINTYVERSLRLIREKFSAHALMVIDQRRNSYITVGEVDTSKIGQQVALITTALSIIKKAGVLFDEQNKGGDWIYHSGLREDFLAGQVDDNHLIISQMYHLENAQAKSKYIEILQGFSEDLKKKYETVAKTEREQIFGQGFNQAVQSELDKLFTTSNEGSNSQLTHKNSDQNGYASQFSMTYEEALAVGLILPTDNANRPEQN
jgi:two-component system, response regulator, stage 0 sporulation protein F